ncbi:thioredoxin-dependent thiol peroxidase [Hathewaya massiliensis]|uniref:thioredoxin-dependent thiol peroxidase n=1 Tax=Hathewaya massiliensis TaxID=1964382 RepID=UPI001159C97B|nr:thioredoxin-dependent thiol peroxidase [Hathewaya massiliensis]
MENLKEGIMAPDFKIIGSDNKEHSLADYKGKKVVLYFYPKDNTPGCTVEAIDFKDNINKFEELNTVILGVSRDSLKSHDKFKEKHCLPFVLLSDEEEVLCNLYGVLKEKNMFGKKCMGIERSTFIINEEGIIKKIFRKVKVANHVEEVLSNL